LPDHALDLTDAALRRVISEYTREAGVRTLERQVGTIARKIAARVAGIDTTRKSTARPLVRVCVSNRSQ
jgi:ATP-dependent Lon protease